MKYFLLFFFGFLLTLNGFSQSEKTEGCTTSKSFDYPPIAKTCHYSIVDGRKKLVSGNYKDGQKVGIWKFYDDNGKLLIKRNYFNNLSYEQLKPQFSKSNNNLNVVQQGVRDSNNLLPFTFMKEKNIKLSIRYLQLNWFLNQEEIVADEVLKKAFSQLLADQSVRKFSSMDFKETIQNETINSEQLNLIGFLTKSDLFFDKVRAINESRIIGIQPLALNNSGDTILLPVFYYPDIRKNLAKTKVNSYDYVEHLDDLFYYSAFVGPIYRYGISNKMPETQHSTPFSSSKCFSYFESLMANEEMIKLTRFSGQDDVGKN